MKIVGLLVSVLAVSLGTPFWFEILQRFMQLRSSGGIAPRIQNQVISKHHTKNQMVAAEIEN